MSSPRVLLHSSYLRALLRCHGNVQTDFSGGCTVFHLLLSAIANILYFWVILSSEVAIDMNVKYRKVAQPSSKAHRILIVIQYSTVV